MERMKPLRRRMTEILFNPVRLVFFKAVRYLIGEGHDQYVDDMYSTQDGPAADCLPPQLCRCGGH